MARSRGRRGSRSFRDHAALAEFEPVISCAVNEEYARLTTPLNHGDEVAFLPPVSGG